jgi:hypothetical protein
LLSIPVSAGWFDFLLPQSENPFELTTCLDDPLFGACLSQETISCTQISVTSGDPCNVGGGNYPGDVFINISGDVATGDVNWTEGSEFVNISADGTIKISKNLHIDPDNAPATGWVGFGDLSNEPPYNPYVLINETEDDVMGLYASDVGIYGSHSSYTAGLMIGNSSRSFENQLSITTFDLPANPGWQRGQHRLFSLNDYHTDSNVGMSIENDAREWLLMVNGYYRDLLNNSFVIKDNTADAERLVISTSGHVILPVGLNVSSGNTYVNISSDGNISMTGQVTLGDDPTERLHAATKEYVDIAVTGVGITLFLTNSSSDIEDYFVLDEVDRGFPSNTITAAGLEAGLGQNIFNFSNNVSELKQCKRARAVLPY